MAQSFLHVGAVELAVTSGSPYPDFARPYPEECYEVRNRLSQLHGTGSYARGKSCPTIDPLQVSACKFKCFVDTIKQGGKVGFLWDCALIACVQSEPYRRNEGIFISALCYCDQEPMLTHLWFVSVVKFKWSSFIFFECIPTVI